MAAIIRERERKTHNRQILKYIYARKTFHQAQLKIRWKYVYLKKKKTKKSNTKPFTAGLTNTTLKKWRQFRAKQTMKKY